MNLRMNISWKDIVKTLVPTTCEVVQSIRLTARIATKILTAKKLSTYNSNDLMRTRVVKEIPEEEQFKLLEKRRKEWKYPEGRDGFIETWRKSSFIKV